MRHPTPGASRSSRNVLPFVSAMVRRDEVAVSATIHAFFLGVRLNQWSIPMVHMIRCFIVFCRGDVILRAGLI